MVQNKVRKLQKIKTICLLEKPILINIHDGENFSKVVTIKPPSAVSLHMNSPFETSARIFRYLEAIFWGIFSLVMASKLRLSVIFLKNLIFWGFKYPYRLSILWKDRSRCFKKYALFSVLMFFISSFSCNLFLFCANSTEVTHLISRTVLPSPKYVLNPF